MSAILVLAIRKLDGNSAVKAFVDIRLGGVTLRGCKIVQQTGARPWVALPSVKNDRGWQNVVEVSRELRERMTEVVLGVWEQRRSARTTVHRIERRDPRADHIDELAARFDERGPDEEIPF